MVGTEHNGFLLPVGDWMGWWFATSFWAKEKQKYYAEKRGIVHTEIMLPPHAPPEYADRNTLWNAAEAVEKQWNSRQ